MSGVLGSYRQGNASSRAEECSELMVSDEVPTRNWMTKDGGCCVTGVRQRRMNRQIRLTSVNGRGQRLCACCPAGHQNPQAIKCRICVQRKRSCEHPRWLAPQIPNHPPSLYLDRMRRFTSIPVHTADRSHHTEITLQVVPKTKYELRLLVDDEERELQIINNRTWEPAKPMYAPWLFHTCTY